LTGLAFTRTLQAALRPKLTSFGFPKKILGGFVMELLPAALRQRLPKLYSQEHSQDPIVHLKFFTPDSNWTWFATEGEPDEDDFRFFGYVCGLEDEWGYFLLSELASGRGPLGLAIERDLYFVPAPFSEVMATERGK
jgi:Protein of unknown function (DUF2958)